MIPLLLLALPRDFANLGESLPVLLDNEGRPLAIVLNSTRTPPRPDDSTPQFPLWLLCVFGFFLVAGALCCHYYCKNRRPSGVRVPKIKVIEPSHASREASSIGPPREVGNTLSPGTPDYLQRQAERKREKEDAIANLRRISKRRGSNPIA